jgi:glycosyltransferase involved in cell wall biosynthesis
MRISIVTISFNQGRFLEQALRSVTDQKHKNVEYIVVDPGSTDGSRQIIEKHRAIISKIIYESDCGPADGLNKGFANATGDIFGYLNADDYFEPRAFRYVADAFGLHSGIDVLCGAVRIIDANGKARVRKLVAEPFDLRRFVAGVSSVGQQGTFFRRQAFERSGGFNSENTTCWDGELLVKFALAKCRFAVMRRVLGNFRIHQDSISGSGRLNYRYLEDRKRLLKQLAAEDVKVHPFYSAALRYCRRANVVRHLRSMTVK